MSGPPPKPTALRIAEGNPSKRRLNYDEPQAQAGEPPMPKGLSASARREWRYIVAELVKLGTLTVVDGKALAAYCETFALWEQARKEIKANGLTFQTKVVINRKQPDGTVVQEVVLLGIKRNPAVAIAFEALRAMKAFLTEFGLTPASRSRLHVVAPPKEDDPVATFMAKVQKAKQPQADA